MFFCMAVDIPYKNQIKIYFNLNIALKIKVAQDDDIVKLDGKQSKWERIPPFKNMQSFSNLLS